MSDWRSDMEQRLSRPPFQERRFRTDMMERVEERLKSVDRKRFRHGWGRAAVVIVPVMFLIMGVGIWFGNQAASVNDPTPASPVTQGGSGGTYSSDFEPGAGGDFGWWSSAENQEKQGNDRTIVTLSTALMKRELGIWGGPSPDIWVHPDVKQPLERYDVSSPWVYEVYVSETSADEAETVYRLRLLQRDSIPKVYQETIDVTVRNDTHLISFIEQESTDETGTPFDEFGTSADQGNP